MASLSASNTTEEYVLVRKCAPTASASAGEGLAVSSSSLPQCDFALPPPITTAAKKSLTCVIAGTRSKNGTRGDERIRGGKARKIKEINRVLGNDEGVPWTKYLRDFSVIEVVGYTQISTLLTSNLAANTYGSASFTAGVLDNFASLSAVYDEYHIAEIEAFISPQYSESTTAAALPGNLVTAVDVDDGNLPTSYDQVASYTSSIQSQGTMGHFHRWKPKYAVATYSGAFTSYSAASGWVDCGSPNVQWYGLKASALAANSTITQVFTLTARFRIFFRGQH